MLPLASPDRLRALNAAPQHPHKSRLAGEELPPITPLVRVDL